MKQIYLEPDEEITSVIDKLSNAPEKQVSLVLAKNSALSQSLVNLKLLAKEAKRLGKDVSLITANKVGARLAKQVGIATYGSAGAVPATAVPTADTPLVPAAEDEVINGVKVKQYDPNRQHPAALEADGSQESPPAEGVNEVAGDQSVAQPAEPAQSFEPTTVKAEPEPPKEPTRHSDDPPDLPPVIARSGGFSVNREVKIPWKSVAVGAAIFLAICLLAFLFVPRAVVTIAFPAHPLNETVAVSAVVDASSQTSGSITGNKATTEKTKSETVTATGKKDVGTKAEGTIPFRNCEDSSAHSVPALSKVNAGGKVFLTDSAVTIPAGSFSGGGTVCNSSSVNVALTAEQAGETYNLSGATFTISGLSTRISGTGNTSGGQTKVVTILSQGDVDTSILNLKKAAKEEALSELTEKTQGQKLLADGVWETVKQEGADKAVGAETESAIVTVQIEYGTIAFDEAAAFALFEAAFEGKINDSEQIVFPPDLPPVYTTKEIAADRSKVDFEIAGTAYKVPKIDKGKIAKSLTNETPTAAEALLKDQYNAETVESRVSPSWWIDRLPLFGWAIRIEYGFNEPVPVAPEAEAPPTQ